jgi:outer membrane receptor protein involved in Fe transport
VVPNVSFAQSAQAGSLYLKGGDNPPYNKNEQTLVAGDQVSKVLRNHLLKVGVYYERDSFNKRTTGQDNGSVTTSYYNPDATGNPFADLLVGRINSSSQSSANIMANMLLPRVDFFAEDLWQAKPRLTLNYGVRVDHIQRWYDTAGHVVIFDPTSPALGSYHVPYIHGPHFQNDELGLFKTFQARDKQRLELRAQAFNWFNHPSYSFIQYDPNLYLQYDSYGGLPVNAGAGTAEQKLGARSIQLSAKYYF